MQPGSDTTSYPINVSFPLTEWIPETIDPSEPPTFQVTYTVEDLDGNQQTGNADLDVSVYPCLGWKVYAFNGFQNYLRWYDYSEAPVGLGSGRTRIRNYLPVPTEGDPYNPNAGGGTAILTFP